MSKGRKTYVDPDSGKRRHTTKWQNLVSQHGIKGAKKHYVGYKQVPPAPTTTGNVGNVKGGTRRVKDSNVGGGRRSLLYYKGDRVGTWAKSRGTSSKGRKGIGWYLERGYGTPSKPVPDTKLTRRLGIANKGDMTKTKKGMLTPGASPGFNPEEEWEVKSLDKKGGKKLQAESFDSELTMWQEAVKKHGIPPAKRAKARGHGAFKDYQGRHQEDGVMYHYGDKTSRWTPSGGYTTGGVNTGRGWFMERGYGHPGKPVPDTALTRKLGIAGAGRQQRQAGGLWGSMKRMLVPSKSGFNTQQDWEQQYFQKHKGFLGGIFQSEGGCCSCHSCNCDCHC